jgi:RimJ/RimL family protein N-acetyltransferase
MGQIVAQRPQRTMLRWSEPPEVNLMNVISETDRLRLRTWSQADAEPFMALAGDPEVVRFITGGVPLDIERVRALIGRQIDAQRERGWCRWALELRDEPGVPIGFCGPGCTFAPEIELGWWLRRDLWGRGLATEAAREALRICFEGIGFTRIISAIHPDNLASAAVAQRIGMEPGGQVHLEGMALDRWVVYSLLPMPVHDPRYRLDCAGAPAGTVLAKPAEADA